MTEWETGFRMHRVVVIGGGFGGLQATLQLRAAPVELTLVDRRNFHLFLPLTYQVATGALSPSEVAYPRTVFRGDRQVRVVLVGLDFRRIDAADARVLLVEGADRVLASFPHSLSKKAARSLRSIGVTLMLGRLVVDVAADAASRQT